MNGLNAALAALPLAVVITALLFRRSALTAALVGAGSAVLVGMGWFSLSSASMASAAIQWWPLITEVLVIVAAGIAFAEVGRRTGAQGVLSLWLQKSLGAGVAPVLAIVHGVTPLIESLTGFGVGATVAIPLLVALGLNGRRAATVGLLGLCAVPWGSMGPGMLIGAELGGVSFAELGVASAVASWVVFAAVGIGSVLVVAPRGGRLSGSLAAIGSATVLWAGVLAANLLIGTAPAGAVGAVVALSFHLFLSRRRRAGLEWPVKMRCAVEPYVVLLLGVMASIVTIRLAGGVDTPWHYLGSPAFWLPVAVLVAARSDMGVLHQSFRGVLITWLRVGLATGLFIVIGVLMATSGMSTQLAQSLAGLSDAYLFAVPFLGALGGFITGSTSGANAMFAATQSQTITALGAGTLPGLAVHNVSASLFTMASPARVELAAKLCPDPPRTAPILLMLLSIDLAAAAFLGAALVMTSAA